MPSPTVLVSPPGFLNLPRELRDAIYEYYVAHPDGYRYNLETGKLQISDGSTIETSFMYTCKQIAAEMKGLALRYNTITFIATLKRNPNTVMRATRFHTIMKTIHERRLSLLNLCRFLITLEMKSNIELSFPHSDSFLQLLTDRLHKIPEDELEISKFWGIVPSRQRDLVTHVLQQIEKTGASPDSVLLFCAYISPPLLIHHAETLRNLSGLAHELWEVPTEVELDKMEQACPAAQHITTGMCRKGCFSATALAAHFLTSLPESMQSAVTRVCLHEIHMVAAFPECHAKALIPSCIRNPKLRIERHVDLWQNLLLGFVF